MRQHQLAHLRLAHGGTDALPRLPVTSGRFSAVRGAVKDARVVARVGQAEEARPQRTFQLTRRRRLGLTAKHRGGDAGRARALDARRRRSPAAEAAQPRNSARSNLRAPARDETAPRSAAASRAQPKMTGSGAPSAQLGAAQPQLRLQRRASRVEPTLGTVGSRAPACELRLAQAGERRSAAAGGDGGDDVAGAARATA